MWWIFSFIAVNIPRDNSHLNAPSYTLRHVFNLLLPQTHADFNQRISILQTLSQKYPKDVRVTVSRNTVRSDTGGNETKFALSMERNRKALHSLGGKTVWLKDIQQVYKSNAATQQLERKREIL